MRSISASASFISSIDSSRNRAGQSLVAPVAGHLGVDEVLVDRRQLRGEHLVEQLDDFVVTLHGMPPAGRLKPERSADGDRDSGVALAGDFGDQALQSRQTPTASAGRRTASDEVLHRGRTFGDREPHGSIGDGSARAHEHGYQPPPAQVGHVRTRSARRRPILDATTPVRVAGDSFRARSCMRVPTVGGFPQV